MINVSNWDERKSHYEDYWNVRNRIPVLSITAPKDGAAPVYETPTDDQPGMPDIHMEIRNSRRYYESTYFGADAYPYYSPSLGTDLISGIMGLELHYNESSSWVRHLDCALADIRDFSFDRDNFYLTRMDDMLQTLTEDARNTDYIVAMVDLNTMLDGVSSLIGPERLCLEMVDHPEDVHRVIRSHIELYKTIYTRYNAIVTRHQKGNTNWLGIYSEIPWYFISNDFSVMISGDFFDEFAVEPLRDLATFHERNLYHLDGENAVVHLDRILGIKELQGVQVQATPYMQSAEFWIPHIRKIQRAGKRTWIDAQNEEEVLLLAKSLEPEGLFIRTWAQTQEQALATEQRLRRFYGK
jgi:hypothetical protein